MEGYNHEHVTNEHVGHTFENIPPETVDIEGDAYDELDALLADPDNAFLTLVPQNRARIEEEDDIFAALAFVKQRITERQSRTFVLETLSSVEGVCLEDLRYDGFYSILKNVMSHAREIGRGGDAFVLVDRSEIPGLPEEVCYKFEIESKIVRGRNSLAREAKVHQKFYNTANELVESQIGVPMPLYEMEIGGKKMLAMERLPAKRLDEVLSGQGTLPEWFDIDEFCDEMKEMLDHLHAKGLYHRDLHPGNLMIAQTREKPDKIAYIIDFGLSLDGAGSLENPYVSEMADMTFTYMNDYGIIEQARKTLRALSSRIS